MSKLYYIQDARDVVGNCASWWKPNGNGYTCNLDEAGKYDAAKALQIEESRGTDIAWPCDEVDAAAIRHVRVDSGLLRGSLLVGRERDKAEQRAYKKRQIAEAALKGSR